MDEKINECMDGLRDPRVDGQFYLDTEFHQFTKKLVSMKTVYNTKITNKFDLYMQRLKRS